MNAYAMYGDEQSAADVHAWVDQHAQIGTVMVLRWCEGDRTDYFLARIHVLRTDGINILRPRVGSFARNGTMYAAGANTGTRLLIPTPETITPAVDGHQHIKGVLRPYGRFPGQEETALLADLRKQSVPKH